MEPHRDRWACAEYFQLKLTLSDDAPADREDRAAEIWAGRAAVASSCHFELAWARDAQAAEAFSPLLGTTLTLVPGTTPEAAESEAADLRSAPYVLAVAIEPRTWTIRRDVPGDAPVRQLFLRLLLAAYLYDPQGIGAAYADLFRNDDEYWHEVETLMRLLPEVTSFQDVEAAIHHVFDWTTAPGDNIESLAGEVWRIWGQEASYP